MKKGKLVLNTALCLQVFILLLVNQVGADTHYMAIGGSDSGDCTSSPCATLQYAVDQMSSGDVLEIADGTYTGSSNYLTNSHVPPSGPGTGSGDARFTIIKAENDFGVTFDLTGTNQGFWNNHTVERDYIKFEGIIFKTDVSGEALIDFGYYGGGSTNCDHIYFKKCGFAKENDSSASFSAIWIANTYMLFEDCFFWGSGKYLLHDRGDHNVYRRCVFRADNLKGGGQPCAVVMSYEGDYIEWQNIIIIDSDRDYWTNFSYVLGGFATHHAADQDGTDYNYIRGSICIANDFNYYSGSTNKCFWLDGTTCTNNEFHDTIAVGSTGGFSGSSGSEYNNFCYNCVSANNADPNGNAKGFSGFERIQDSISYNNEYGVSDCPDADYVNSYGNDTNWSSTTHTNDVAGDPNSNGWLYPSRIESGSTLKTAGYGGGRVGAQITKRIGTDGTFYGESGYNTTTDVDLWPWPNEDAIRLQMRDYSPTGGPSGTRGFCADGQTLTRYIWGYLGNTIPPFNIQVPLVGNQSVRLTWDANTYDGNVTGYKVYAGPTSGNYSFNQSTDSNTLTTIVNNLNNNAAYYFVVTAVDSVKGESGYSYEISGTPIGGIPPSSPTNLTVKE